MQSKDHAIITEYNELTPVQHQDQLSFSHLIGVIIGQLPNSSWSGTAFLIAPRIVCTVFHNFTPLYSNISQSSLIETKPFSQLDHLQQTQSHPSKDYIEKTQTISRSQQGQQQFSFDKGIKLYLPNYKSEFFNIKSFGPRQYWAEKDTKRRLHFDFCIGILQTPIIFDKYLSLAFLSLNYEVQEDVIICGYPELSADNRGGFQLVKSSGKINSQDGNLLKYGINTRPGMSGSPIITKLDGQFVVVGMHATSYGSQDRSEKYNYGIKNSFELMQQLQQLIPLSLNYQIRIINFEAEKLAGQAERKISLSIAHEQRAMKVFRSPHSNLKNMEKLFNQYTEKVHNFMKRKQYRQALKLLQTLQKSQNSLLCRDYQLICLITLRDNCRLKQLKESVRNFENRIIDKIMRIFNPIKNKVQAQRRSFYRQQRQDHKDKECAFYPLELLQISHMLFKYYAEIIQTSSMRRYSQLILGLFKIIIKDKYDFDLDLMLECMSSVLPLSNEYKWQISFKDIIILCEHCLPRTQDNDRSIFLVIILERIKFCLALQSSIRDSYRQILQHAQKRLQSNIYLSHRLLRLEKQTKS